MMHRPDFLAHQCDDFLLNLRRRTVNAGLEHNEAARHLAFQVVLDAKHCTFGNIRMRGQHFLHAAG